MDSGGVRMRDVSRRFLCSLSLKTLAKKFEDSASRGHLVGAGESMPLAGKYLDAMRCSHLLQELFQLPSFSDRNHAVFFAMQHESGRHALYQRTKLRGHAAEDVHHGRDALILRSHRE